tara:strand:+ start:1033 stop:1224 length:192 start_codon:yes stop_codon:yes gene_type:complete
MKTYIVTQKNWYEASLVGNTGLSSFSVKAPSEDEAWDLAWEEVFGKNNEDLTVVEVKEDEVGA